MSEQKSDPWQESLHAKVDRIGEIVSQALEKWGNAEENPAIRQAAENFNPQKVVSEIDEICSEISTWHIEEHNKIIKDVCKEIEIKPDPWLIGVNAKWLWCEALSEIKQLEAALERLKKQMSATADYLETHTGLWGVTKNFVKGAVEGYLFPLKALYDTAKNVLSGLEDPEWEQIRDGLVSAITDVEAAEERLSQVLAAKCVSRYNDKTVGALKDIENSLLQSKVQPAPSIFKRIFWGIIKLAFLAALILSGLVLLKKIGVF